MHLRASFWSPPGLDREIANRFEATHPGVKIDLLITGGRYAEKLQSMIVAGNEPDIIMVHDTFYHEWASRGVLADLTEFVRTADRADPFVPVMLDAFGWNGRLYAVPVDCNAMVTFGNLDAAASAGLPYPWHAQTWAQLEALGPRLSRRDNPHSPTDYLCALPQPPFFLTAFGGRCFDDPHHPRSVVVDSPTTREAFDYWRRMHQRGWAVPRSVMLDQGEAEMFRDGRIAFFFWGRAPSKIVRTNPKLHWDLAPVPTGASGSTTPHLSMAVGISRRSKHADLAREYLRFYISDAGVEPAVRAGQIVPAVLRQARGEVLLGEHPPASSHQYVDAMLDPGATAIAYCPGRIEAEEIVQKRFEQALAEPEIPTARIVADLATDLRAWLARMQAKGLL